MTDKERQIKCHHMHLSINLSSLHFAAEVREGDKIHKERGLRNKEREREKTERKRNK